MLKNSILKSFRSKYIKPLWSPIAYLIIKLGGVPLASFLTFFGIDWGEVKKNNPTVLCILREGFSKDIVELRKRTNINYICIRGGFVRFQAVWVPKKMQIQTFYQQQTGIKCDKAIDKSIQFAMRLIKKISRVQKVDAVMSANFDYWQDVGFKKACKTLEIPFLVLSREHLTIPKSFDNVTRWYKNACYRFEGAGIAVAGQMTYEVFKAVSHIIDMKDVWVTGLPRFDVWRDVNTLIPLNNRKYITLLTYTRGYLADENFNEMVKLFAKIALQTNREDIEFIVKCKSYDDKNDVLDILKHENTSRLKFTYEWPLYDLLPKSRLVIGYNSLALVEAVMAKAVVVVPYWGECENDERDAMYSPKNSIVEKAMIFASKQQDIKEAIHKSITNKYIMSSDNIIHNFVNNFFYIPKKATVSNEVEKIIRHYI